MFKKMMLAILAIAVVASTAHADRRKYVWTYHYGTVPKGQTELELYQTTKVAELNTWEFKAEIEHGLTDNLDFSVYQIFVQKEGQSLKWDAFQVRWHLVNRVIWKSLSGDRLAGCRYPGPQCWNRTSD